MENRNKQYPENSERHQTIIICDICSTKYKYI